MPGKAVGIAITYQRADCGEQFEMWQGAPANAEQVTLQLEEKHEDCPQD